MGRAYSSFSLAISLRCTRKEARGYLLCMERPGKTDQTVHVVLSLNWRTSEDTSSNATT